MAERTLMIVDDDVDLLEELADLLSASGYRVVRCADAAGAMRTATEERPDVILIDILMPGMNGLAVVERLREHAACSRTPIVVMSGRCTEREGGVLTRVNRLAGFVAKPINVPNLLSLLEGIVS